MGETEFSPYKYYIYLIYMINNILNNIISYFQKISELKWHQKLYMYGTMVSIIFFILSIIGISYDHFKYIPTLQFILKLYVSIILIIHFNPYTEYKKSDVQQRFDRKLAFTAGIFLLLTTSFINSLEYYIKNTKDIITKNIITKV